MSKKPCYFKCNYEGPIYAFPPVTYTSYQKYCKWKNILRKKDRGKDDHYVIQHFKLCSNHFESHYFAANRRLIKHAVPTLIHGITFQQEELLCSFIENNSKLIMGYNLNGEMVEEVIAKWKAIAPKLNELGPEKSHNEWAEFLYDIMTNLKTKQVVWKEETGGIEADTELVSNSDDFSELELKILNLWRREIQEDSSEIHDSLEINIKDENDVEYMIEVGEGDNSRESDFSYKFNNSENKRVSEIVTFTLNVATGGQKPLLQAADVSPYEACKDSSIKCKCKSFNSRVQDRFDAFGKEIAEQLRTMPAETAMETQRLLSLVLRKKQRKLLNESFLQD